MGMFDWLMPQQQAQAPVPVAPPLPEVPFTQMQTPQQDQSAIVGQLNQPTTDPKEIAARKEGWGEVLRRVTGDPNMMRALGFFGQTISAPIPYGGNLASQFANAATVATSAYDFGKQAQFDQTLAVRKELRAQTESEANVESTKASTEQARTRTKGLQTANEVAEATKSDVIKKVQLENEKTEQDLINARNETERSKILLDKEKRQKSIFDSIPDATLRQQAIDQAQAQGIINKQHLAAANAANAAAGASSAHAQVFKAQAGQENLRLKDLEAMSPEERRQFDLKTKTGMTSGVVQQLDAYQSIWKQANPKKAGEDDTAYKQRGAQAVQKFMTEAKGKDETDQILKFAEQFGKSGEDHVSLLKRWRQFKSLQGETALPATSPAPGTTPAGAVTGQVTAATVPVGGVYNGYRYKGGPRNDPKSWEKVQ